MKIKTTLSLITYILCSNATAKQTQEIILVDNPYTNAIRAGMLPATAAKEKEALLKKIKQKVTSLTPYLALIESYYMSNNLDKIVTLIQTKKELQNLVIENGKTGIVVVKTYIKLQKNKKAMGLLIELNKKHPSDQEIAFLTAQFYETSAQTLFAQKKLDASKKELQKAIAIVDKYLNTAPKRASNFAFLFLRSRIHLKLDAKEKALKDIEEALEMQPQFEMGWFIFSQLKEKKGELQEAINGYTHYLDIVSSRPRNIAGQVLFKAVEAKLLKLLFMQLVKKHPTFDQNKINHYKQKIMHLFQQNKYKEALKALDECFSGDELQEEKRLVKLQILSELGQNKIAANLVKNWILENPNNHLWFESLYLLSYAGLNTSSVISILKKVEKKHPNHLLTSLYLADIMTKANNKAEAINYHNKSLTLITGGYLKDHELRVAIYYQLGILYSETNQIKKMKVALKKGNTTFVQHLAKVYKKQGKKHKTTNYIKRAAQLAKNVEKKKKHLQLAHKRENKPNESKVTLLCCR